MEETVYCNKQKPSYYAWDEIRPELLEKLETGGMSHEDSVSFLVAAEEIYVNIVMHGYPKGILDDDFCETSLLIRADEKEKSAVIIFRDNGVLFDPLQVPEREPLTTAKGVKPGGFGIALARNKTDGMKYSCDGEYNRLSMKKCF